MHDHKVVSGTSPVVPDETLRGEFLSPATLSLLARGGGVIAMAIGALTLLGWALDIEALKSVVPGFVAMNPATAIAFLCAGLALNLLQRHNGIDEPTSTAVQCARLLAAIVALIGFLKLVAIVIGIDVAVDHTLFRAKLDHTGTGLPNRMAPNTALNFTLLGLALLLFDVRSRRRLSPSQPLALAVSVLSLLAIVGYVYGARSFYGVATFIPMALNTAACFLLLAMGVLLSRPERGFMTILNSRGLGGTVARRLLPAAILIPIGLGWLPQVGTRAHYYGPEFSFALLVTFVVTVFAVLTCWTATSLEVTEARRRRAEAERQRANDEALQAHRDAERARTEAERARTEAERARAESEKANQAKSEFLSRMSHELRTPLNAILGFGQLLEIEELTEEQADGVSHILRAGNHLLGLINEVLDISRVEAGRLSLSVEAVPIAPVVTETIDLIRPQARLRDISIRQDSNALRHTHVQADQQRMKQVLLNLLSNAIKYNHKGGGITVTCATTDTGRVRIAVTDTGPGIAPDDLAKLFTPFERLQAAMSEIEGTGLGLSLSKGLMEAMHGTLSAQSTVGSGSCFTMELPAGQTPVRETVLPEGSGQDDTPAREAAETRTLLSIEDNLANHKLIESILTRRPEVRLLAAMQGQIGYDLAVQHQPDLILLDLHLPDMMGHDVLLRLRETAETKDIPVVVVSADATDAQIKRLLAAGAKDYLVKPLNIKEFLSVVDEHLWPDS